MGTGRTLAIGGAVVGLVGAVAVGGTVAALAGYVRVRSAPLLRTVATVPAVGVALVLGAQVSRDGRPSSFLRNRLDLAVALHRAAKVEIIIVSGERSLGYDEPGAMRNYLVQKGIPADRVMTDAAGYDTYDSCYRAREVFGVERLVVVSQSYHLPRALTICHALGLEAYGVGDRGAYSSGATWRRGRRRELLANVKMAWDLLSHRVPTLDPTCPAP